MAKKKSIYPPKVYLYRENDNTIYGGRFGDLPLFNSYLADIPLRNLTERDNRVPPLHFKDVCFGPYISFTCLDRMQKTHSIDDCLVAFDSGEGVIYVFDRDNTDNEPRKIDWYNRDSKQEPIFFEAQLGLYAKPKVVREPKYATKGQSFIETEVFKIIQDMGFDCFESDTEIRFFNPLPRVNESPVKKSVAPDSAFLLKCDSRFYAWYKIYSAKHAFEVAYFEGDKCRDHYSIPNTVELIKNLQKDRERRNQYLQQQYSR